MGIARQRAKKSTRRTKPIPAADLPELPWKAVDSAENILAAILADLPGAPPQASGVPDAVRKNRRERARRRLLDALKTRGDYPIPDALRAELRLLAERWARKGFEDAFPEADDFEVRCADERAVLDAAARGDQEERFAAAERAYRREVEKKHGRIEIRGLQLSARVHQDLEIAYVPLHVEAPPREASINRLMKKLTQKTPEGRVWRMDAERVTQMVRALERPRVPVTRALSEHPRLLLTGEPGSGKSTLIAYLATLAARGTLASETGWKADPVPFVVPVRSLSEAPSMMEALARAAGAEGWFMEEALQRGRALLLIDGLDEVHPTMSGKLLPGLAAILEAHPGARSLLTTRPTGAPGEDEPTTAGFVRMRLVPMTRQEVSTFIDQWCLAAELSLDKVGERAEADARAAAEDLKERVRASRAIEKLAQTPLLCSVICVVHRFLGQRIPERRVALYEAITNVLLYEWDRAKFPPDAATAKLDAHAKRALLARLARSMHEARVAELPAEKVIKIFAAHLPDVGRPAAEARKIVAEIRERNGVLVERAPGSFAFSHLTFQEYLAALDMVNAHEYEPLLQRYEDEWWHEVIVLAAGFPGGDAAKIVRGLLDADGNQVDKGTMLAAQCAETAVELKQSLRKEIDTRVAHLVPPNNMVDLMRLTKLGELAGPTLLRSLGTSDANGKAKILTALGFVFYEPAIGTIRKLMRDPSKTTIRTFSMEAGNSIALSAAITLHSMSYEFESALSAFLEESSSPSLVLSDALLSTLRTTLIKGRAFKDASSVASPPRRAARSG